MSSSETPHSATYDVLTAAESMHNYVDSEQNTSLATLVGRQLQYLMQIHRQAPTDIVTSTTVAKEQPRGL